MAACNLQERPGAVATSASRSRHWPGALRSSKACHMTTTTPATAASTPAQPLAGRAQHLLTQAGGLESVNSLRPLEAGMEDVRHIDGPASQRDAERRGHPQGQEGANVVSDDIDGLTDPGQLPR